DLIFRLGKGDLLLISIHPALSWIDFKPWKRDDGVLVLFAVLDFGMILQKRKKVLKNFPILFLQLQNNDSSNSITSHAYERDSVCPSCCCMRALDLLVLLPKFPAFPIVIVLL